VLNSAALHACGLHADSPPPASSVELERDADGALTGRILEHHFIPLAEHTILRAAPRFDHALRVEALRRAMRLSLAAGTTSVYEGHGVAAEVLRVYKEVHDRGEQQVRAYLPISPPPWGSLAEAEREIVDWAHYASGPGFGDAWLKVGGIHFSYGGQPDLTPLSQAAWPDTGWAGFGEQYHSPDEYRALCRLAARHHLRVNTIVDTALDEVLAIWEAVHAEYPIVDLRWVLVHAVKLEPARDFPRIKRLGCVMTALPPSALYRAGLALAQSEPELHKVLAYRAYTEAGLAWALATDNKPHRLLFHLWAAVNRRERLENWVIGPEQRLTVPQALRALTYAGAYLCFEEREKGSLEVGKLADLQVLSDDPLHVDPDALKDLHVELTMVDGCMAHDTRAIEHE
jgi:predicted amidohydrolase YtcJ